MTRAARRRLRVLPFLSVWATVAATGLMLLTFLGMTYVALLAALLHFTAGGFMASEQRWTQFADFFWEPTESGSDPNLRRAATVLLLTMGVVWLGFALLFALFANVRLVDW